MLRNISGFSVKDGTIKRENFKSIMLRIDKYTYKLKTQYKTIQSKKDEWDDASRWFCIGNQAGMAEISAYVINGTHVF